MCCYFGNIIVFEDFDFNDILLNEKRYEKILIHKILYKTLIGPKPLRIKIEKIDVLIRVYDRSRYLVLNVPEKYDFIYNKFRYLIGVVL